MKKYFNTDEVTIPYIIKNLEILPRLWHTMYLNVEKDYSTSIDLFSSKKEMEMKAIVNYGIEPMKASILESFRAGKLALATKQNLLKYLREVADYQKNGLDSINVANELDLKVEKFINGYS